MNSNTENEAINPTFCKPVLSVSSTLTHGSLFSGIGGFELGAQRAGIPTVWNCEIVEFNRKILKQHFPETKQYEDITKLRNPEPVSIISGGFPCQDLSIAGKGKGLDHGERSGLWSEMFRIIDETRPAYVVIENSPELLKKGFEKVLYPLSEIGYNAEWQCLQAKQFGMPHRRERVYVIAYSSKIGRRPSIFTERINDFSYDRNWYATQSFKSRNQWECWLKQISENMDGEISKPDFFRSYDGVPKELDVDRIAACGNAVVPAIAEYLFNCILEHHKCSS